ncbi:MAG: hypothetical protein ACT4QF_06430 [Sporichthyaceae bacterium]
MRAPRWAVALTATGIVGAGSLALALPGSALAGTGVPAAETTRFTLTARADALHFQINGDEVPAAQKNDAGSATASVQTNNSGGSKSFAGAPYYGNTVQTAPGLVNGIPNQFGAGQVQLPFGQLPGYVQVNSTNEKTSLTEEGQYYRVAAEALPSSGKASSFFGAPATLPAPNQQQSATAETKSEGSKVVASAFGSSQGIVTGPLEIANSTAIASINQAAGAAPKIESKTFGRFSVSGQEFGFDQNGFKYLGQDMSSKDAVDQANGVLTAANIKIALAPAVQEKSPSGGTQFTIGGLTVTTTQDSPTGAGKFEFTYTLGRVVISADVAKLGLSASNSAERAATENTVVPATKTSTGSTKAKASQIASDGVSASSLDSFAPEALQDEAAAVPTTVATVAEDGSISESVATEAEIVQPSTVSTDTIRTLGFAPAGTGNVGDSSMLLYIILVAAGAGLVGGPFLFTKFAGTPQG